MRIAYIGNFRPEHSTENHVKIAFNSLGHEIIPVQENDHGAWKYLIRDMSTYDLVLWTTTHPYAEALGPELQVKMLAAAKNHNINVVGYHLDRWHGLDREHLLYTAPFFRCDKLFTANGGSNWEEIGVDHTWLPPAVSLPETELGRIVTKYVKNVVFVGTWRNYHKEWEHRAYLITFLKENFPRDTYLWPRPGQPGIRGHDLQDLYRSSKIVIGDSCLSGGITHYWSDRIPETVGRGGFLLHPNVVGLDEHFKLGEHFVTWNIGDWDDLHAKITYYLAHGEEAHEIAMNGRDHVREHHTYEVRAQQILDAL